jgi:hypothetical protein
LKYAYLDEKNIYPIIISANLLDEEDNKLLNVLKTHRAAIGYSLKDLKGISLDSVVDHQHHINPKMKELVRSEVIKLTEQLLFILLLIVNGYHIFIVFLRREVWLLLLTLIMN